METCKLKFSFLIYLFFRCRRQSCRPCSLPTPCPSGRSPRRRTSPSRAEKPESLGELSLYYLVFLVLGRSPQRRTSPSRAEKPESLGKSSLYYLVILVSTEDLILEDWEDGVFRQSNNSLVSNTFEQPCPSASAGDLSLEWRELESLSKLLLSLLIHRKESSTEDLTLETWSLYYLAFLVLEGVLSWGLYSRK